MIPFVIGHVQAVGEFDEILRFLDSTFERTGPAPGERLRLIGLLIAPQHLELTQKEVLPSLSHLHHRSGSFVDFFCCGYWKGSGDPDPETGTSRVANGWMYSDWKFENFRRSLESATTWRRSPKGGVELILTNARYNPATGILSKLSPSTAPRSELDFTTTLVLDLDAMKRDGAIASVSELFERICRYAEDPAPGNPAAGVSDALGGAQAVNAIKDALLHALPESLRKKVESALRLATKNISKP